MSGPPVVSMNAALMGFDSCAARNRSYSSRASRTYAPLMGPDSCVVAERTACPHEGRSHYNTQEGQVAASESSPLVPAPPSLVSGDNPFPFWRNFLMAQVL